MAPTELWRKGLAGLVLLGGFVLAADGDPPAVGNCPWTVRLGPSPGPVGPFAKVHLPKVSFKRVQPHGAALSLRSRKAVVFYLDAMLGYAKTPKVILCDLKKG